MDHKLAKAIRETLGITQEELGRQMSVHRRTIIRWEKGTIPIPGPAATILNQMKEEAMRAAGLITQDEPVNVKKRKRKSPAKTAVAS